MAILGVVGFDLAKQEFFVDCKAIGESAKDITHHYGSQAGKHFYSMIVSLVFSAIGGLFLYYGLKSRKRRSVVKCHLNLGIDKE